jgi:hypothetical protein
LRRHDLIEDAVLGASRVTIKNEPFIVTKRAVRVVLQLSNGQRVPGVVHTNLHSSVHHGRERVKDVLNDPSPMLPVHGEDGTCTLFNKSFIEVVELEQPDLAETGETDLTDHREISLVLADGLQLAGTILVSTPPERARTLDFLNRGEPFFYLETQQGSRVIALRYVLSVRDY